MVKFMLCGLRRLAFPGRKRGEASLGRPEDLFEATLTYGAFLLLIVLQI